MTIDDMTAKWLSLTPNPLRIPVFYTLTKIPNRHLLVDVLYQGVTALQKGSQLLLTTLAQKQASYLKDTTDFLNFIEKTKLPKNTIMSVNGRHQPLHEHTTGGGYYHFIRSIRRILLEEPSDS